MGVRDNLLWALIGIPLGIATMFYYFFSCRRRKIDLQSKVVFITGASSGLGEACAEAFYKAGCRIVLSGRKVQRLMDLRDRLIKMKGGPSPAVVTIDLEDLVTIPSKVEQVAAAFGQIDILINNAGMSYRGTASETLLQVDRRLMDVNFFGHIEVTKAVLPYMRRQKRGHIVVISSVQGKLAIPHRSAYAASKHALQAYFDSLRAELSPYNIFVSVISPYYIKTDLSVNAIKSDGSTYGAMDVNTRQGLRPEYVANKVVNCVTRRKDEVTLAPFHVQVAIALRALAPWLYFHLMNSRARKEISEMKSRRK